MFSSPTRGQASPMAQVIPTTSVMMARIGLTSIRKATTKRTRIPIRAMIEIVQESCSIASILSRPMTMAPVSPASTPYFSAAASTIPSIVLVHSTTGSISSSLKVFSM